MPSPSKRVNFGASLKRLPVKKKQLAMHKATADTADMPFTLFSQGAWTWPAFSILSINAPV